MTFSHQTFSSVQALYGGGVDDLFPPPPRRLIRVARQLRMSPLTLNSWEARPECQEDK